MLFLVTGASGVGKSTVRRALLNSLPPSFWACELAEVAGRPQWSLEWRQRAVEKVVRRAIRHQAEGRHSLVCGDPVPPGEVVAAPSASSLQGLRVCLLDASPEAQAARLRARGDVEHLVHHQAFAVWMRGHVHDPRYRLDVLQGQGWEKMRWDRLEAPGCPWGQPLVIDTTNLEPDEVAHRVLGWLIGPGAVP